MKNHKATKPAFNVGPLMAFRWRAYIGIWILPQTKKNVKDSPLTKLSGSARAKYMVSISLDKQALRA